MAFGPAGIRSTANCGPGRGAILPFRYPVTDVFFSLRKSRFGARRLMHGCLCRVFPPETGMVPLKRAGVEYQAANILAAYAATHGDLRPMYEDNDDMTVYHVSGPMFPAHRHHC